MLQTMLYNLNCDCITDYVTYLQVTSVFLYDCIMFHVIQYLYFVLFLIFVVI